MKKTIFQRLLAVAMVVTLLFTGLHLPSMVEAAPEPELSEITFSDYISYNPSTGVPEGAVQDGLYVGDNYVIGTISGKHATLDDVAFNGIVKFTDDVEQNPQNTCIRIGGPSQWNQWPGIGIYYDNGIVLANYTGVSDGQLCYVPETEPATFLNAEAIIRVTFQVENVTDIRITFSINGTEYYNDVVVGLAGVLGHGILVYGEGAGIELKSYLPQKELSEITFSDYIGYNPSTGAPEGAVQDGLYDDSNYIIGTISEKHATLDNVVFNGIVKFTEIVNDNPQNTCIRIGGPSQWNQWPGIGIYYDNGIVLANYTGVSDGQLCHVPETDPVTFLNEEVIIRVAFQVENGTDIRVIFSINGIEYYNDVVAGLAGVLGHGILIYGAGAGIEIKSYLPGENPLPEPEPEPEPEWTPSEDLTVITPADFGLTVKNITSFEHGTYEGVVLDGTRFTTMITLPERQNGTYLRFGGTDAEGWTGLGLKVWKSDTSELEVSDNSGNTSYIDYIAAKADEALLGQQVKLDITTEFIDADNDEIEDDVLYGIFFDDELYKTIVFNDHTQYVGKKIMFYTDSAEYPILLEYELEEIQKPELQSVTMQSMGIMDGKYTFCGDLVAQGSHTDTLVGTTLTQKITFSEHAGTWFHYAGGESAWYGIRFVTQEDGSITFKAAADEFSNNGVLTPEIAGTDLLGEEIELGIELFENGENVMMGVYINGILYNDQYFTLLGAKGKLGNYASFYVSNDEGYVIIGKPVAAPSVDDSFKKITFNSYDMESGIYKYNPLGLSASGDGGLTSLDRVVFSDTVNFSDAAGVQMRFGGKTSPWEGMVWESIGDGKLQLTAATGGFPAMVFDSETAGVKLTGNDVEVIFSFEYVDSDGDGKKDDVKFGVWFDGKAYNDRWIYLRDYAEKLGGYLGVYCPNEQTTLKIYTYMPPIDFAEFGFTVNWAIELGLKKK